MRRGMLAVLIAGLVSACGAPPEPTLEAPLSATPGPLPPPSEAAPAPAATAEEPHPMVLRSPAYESDEEIPVVHTCDGDDTSPALIWESLPEGAASLALVFDDPDAGGWVHWIAYDLSPGLDSLPAGLGSEVELPGGGQQGANTWGELGYGGPCPPSGRHRYVFTLYALDSDLGLAAGASAVEVLAAAEGHVLAAAELAGTYQRP